MTSICVLLLTLFGLLVRREWRFRTRAIRSDEAAMLHEIDVPDAVLVSVWTVQGWAITGHDRGALWIEDGRLVFSGYRTSFALPRSSVSQVTSKRHGPGDFELELDRPTPVGPLRISVATLVGDRPFAAPIERTIANWREIQAESSAEGQWPPLELGPEAPGAGRLLGRWAVKRCVTALIVCFLGMPVAVAFGIYPVFIGLLILGFVGSFVLPPLSRSQPIRDRKALEKG